MGSSENWQKSCIFVSNVYLCLSLFVYLLPIFVCLSLPIFVCLSLPIFVCSCIDLYDMLRSLLLIFSILINVNSLNLRMSSVSNEMRNICDGLSKDLSSVLLEKHPFCGDISKQYWLAIAGGPGMIYLSINHHYLYHCHRQYIIIVIVIVSTSSLSLPLSLSLSLHHHNYLYHCHYQYIIILLLSLS